MLPLAPMAPASPAEGSFRFDAKRADRVCHFIERFVLHTKGRYAGKPFLLAPWQRDEIIRPLYGTIAYDSQYEEWTRQYRIAWLEMARKNGKSEVLSALALYHLVGDGEQSAEVYSVAADRDQASLVFNVAKRMIELSPVLSKTLEVVDSRKRIVYPKTNGVYQVLPGDSAGALGSNPSCVLFDEVLTQRDRSLWDAMRQGFGTRREPILIAATTAAYTTAAFALAEHEYGQQVLAQPELDPSRFCFIRGVPRDADWKEEGQPACKLSGEHDRHLSCGGTSGTGWYYANPALGDFLNIHTLRGEAKEADLKPSAQNSFRVFRLNQWTSQAERWLDMAVWDANGVEPVTRELMRGRQCFAGLDLASTQDFTAWLLLFRGSPLDANSEGFTVLPHFFLPRAALEARSSMRDRFEVWEREGYLTVTEGPVTDYSVVLDRIQEDAETFGIAMVGYDPWNATHLVSILDDRGQATVKVPMTAPRLNDPCKALESTLADRKLYHGGHPILRWMADNVELEITGDGYMKPSRKKSGEKIDGIAALVTALFVSMIPTDADVDVAFIPFSDDEAPSDTEGAEELTEFLAAWNIDSDDDSDFRNQILDLEKRARAHEKACL